MHKDTHFLPLEIPVNAGEFFVIMVAILGSDGKHCIFCSSNNGILYLF